MPAPLDRRRFLKGVGVAFGATIALPACTRTRGAATARAGETSLRIPGEFESTRAVWLGADLEDPDFMAVTARMAAAIAPHAALKILVRSDDGVAQVRSALVQAGVAAERFEMLVHPQALFYVRDAVTFCIDDGGQLGVVDFKWNTYGLAGWCRDHLYPGEPSRAEKCAAFANLEKDVLDRWIGEQLRAKVAASPLYLEGGAIEVNGRGVLLVSEPLALQRNSGRSRAALEQDLLALPGIRKVIWLVEGAAEDPQMKQTITGDLVGFGAGGHTDEFVRFADPNTVLLAWIDDDAVDSHPLNRINRERMQRNLEILAAATDQDGRPFRILKVPMPHVISREVVLAERPTPTNTWAAAMFPEREGKKAGDRVRHVAAASYLNYVVVNDLVLVPSYVEDGTPPAVQQRVRSIFEQAFVGRTVQFLHATPLNWFGGGIHCATNNEPGRT